jgi:hypothetical protein
MKNALPDIGRMAAKAAAGQKTAHPVSMNRLVHMHIPKTAGTSLRTAIEQCTSRKMRVFPQWHEEEYHSFSPEDYDFYSGHIGYDTARKIGGDIFTVFRHPVERFISVYYFWKHLYNTNQEVRQATIIASKYSLEDFVRITDISAITDELYNRMTFQVAYGASMMHREHLRTEGKTDEEIFGMAVENLGTFAEIGIQEDLKEFEMNIRARYGLDITIGSLNQNEDRIPTKDISFNTKARILDWLYMDMELYEHVLKLRRARAAVARHW